MEELVVMEVIQVLALPMLVLMLSVWVMSLGIDSKLAKKKLVTNTALIFILYVLAILSPNGDLETIIFIVSGSLIAVTLNTRGLMDKQENNSIIGLSTISLVMMSLSISSNEEVALFSSLLVLGSVIAIILAQIARSIIYRAQEV